MTEEEKKLQKEIDEQASWIVQNEIVMCGTWLMDDLIRVAEEYPRVSAIDIAEYWDKCTGDVCPECGSKDFITKIEYDRKYGNVQGFDSEDNEEDNEEENFDYYCEDCENKFDYPQPIEVFEYWFVDEFLAKRLEAKNEIVITTPGRPIWGRQASGQAIYLDGVIQEIAKEMVEQRKQWKKSDK